ncbi:mg2+ transporter [Fusarium globosum]|uniref:Mg2+ transporter n=1 Tax=Fusarium globosum TaxID=78864 RepID=A0A8H5Y649_9HYPO|nr:mg2+ transporter [Fusarium globosum]
MPQRYRNGATKAPDTPGSKRARACDYPESLSLAEVNALFTESQEPHDAESSTQSSNRHHSDRSFIDVEEQGPVPDFLGHAMPIPNSFNGDHFSRGGARDSFMRSWVNQVLISDVHGLNLHEKQTHVIYSTRGSSEAYRAWFNPTLWLEGQATRADLFDIGYAEYYQDFARSHSFTLNSLGYRGRPKRDVKFRWMHLESISSNFRMLENLVTECPFISNSLRSVALKVLLEASQQCSKPDASRSQIDTGTVIRYVGRYRVHAACTRTDTQDTQPVIFASTPHLLMAQKPTAAPVSVEPRKRNLIEFLYGSESGSFQQPWSGESTANGFKHSVSDMLEVPEASFLLIGSGSAEFNETSTDVSSYQATALEPSHTRIYKSEPSRPNEVSFSISNHEAEVWPSFTQQPADTPDKVDQDSSKSCLDPELDSIAVYYMGMPFMIRSYRSYDNASSVSPQYLDQTETTQRFPDVSTSTHERINLSKHDNIRTLLAKQRVLDSPLKGPSHWFLSHCEGQDTNSGLVGDGSVLSHKLMDKIQQAILKSPFELLLTKTTAYTRDSVYDRCQILCSITDKEMSPTSD